MFALSSAPQFNHSSQTQLGTRPVEQFDGSVEHNGFSRVMSFVSFFLGILISCNPPKLDTTKQGAHPQHMEGFGNIGDTLYIKDDRVVLNKELASGSYGTLWQGTCSQTPVVIKMLRLKPEKLTGRRHTMDIFSKMHFFVVKGSTDHFLS